VAEVAGEWRRRVPGAIGIHAVSAVTGAGLDQLRSAIFAAVPDAPPPARAPAAAEFEAEHITYRPSAQGFEIEPEEGAFRVSGRGIELLVARHDLENEEALAYLEQRLTEIGVVAALRRAGFEPGDEVRIGEQAFELDPG
jgi:GTP-binding protein